MQRDPSVIVERRGIYELGGMQGAPGDIAIAMNEYQRCDMPFAALPVALTKSGRGFLARAR